MRRFKSVYIIIPLIVLVFFVGIRPVYAGPDLGDIIGGGVGWKVGAAACTLATGGVGGPVCWGVGLLGAIFGSIFGGNIAEIVVGPIVEGLVKIAVAVINSIIVVTSTILFYVANLVVEAALQMNASLADSTVIKEGFKIVLDVANLGLVVAIVIAAFMVMLRRGKANQILLRFVVVAILINFSFLIITNFFIKPVDEITEVLHRASNFDFNSFASTFIPDLDFGAMFNKFTSDLGASHLTQENQEVLDRLPSWAVNTTTALLSVIFLFSFTTIGILVLLSFAGMLFIRYVALALLIILAPLAWVAWIFPNIKIPGGNPSQLWWSSFIKWLLFAPISMFFFFLAIRTTTSQDILEFTNPPSEDLSSELGMFATSVGNMLLIVGFLLGGLIVAKKMSITGSGWVLNMAKNVGKNIKGAMADRAKLEYGKAKKRVGNSPTLKKRLEGLASFGSDKGFAGKTLTGPLRGIGKGAMGATQRGENAVKEYYKKKYKDWAPYRLNALLKNENLSDEEYTAIQSVMDGKGSMWETPIGKHLGRIYDEGVVAKTGSQKEQIGWMKEGLIPAALAGIDRGESPEALMALLAPTADDMSENTIASIGDAIMADYDPDTQHYGLTEDQHKKLQDAWTAYTAQRRSNALSAVRKRQKPSGQINLDRAAWDFMAANRDVKDLLSLSPDKQEQVVKEDWDTPGGLKEREIARAEAGIDAVKDPKWNKPDKDGKTKKDREKARIRQQINSLGWDGYLKRVQALQDAQRRLLAVMSEQFGGGETPPTPTVEGA